MIKREKSDWRDSNKKLKSTPIKQLRAASSTTKMRSRKPLELLDLGMKKVIKMKMMTPKRRREDHSSLLLMNIKAKTQTRKVEFIIRKIIRVVINRTNLKVLNSINKIIKTATNSKIRITEIESLTSSILNPIDTADKEAIEVVEITTLAQEKIMMISQTRN